MEPISVQNQRTQLCRVGGNHVIDALLDDQSRQFFHESIGVALGIRVEKGVPNESGMEMPNEGSMIASQNLQSRHPRKCARDYDGFVPGNVGD
jgi:hypothetical protein